MPTELVIIHPRLSRFFRSLVPKPRSSRRNLRIDLLDETRPGRPLPHLPPELWAHIIRFATTPDLAPDPVDTTSAISFLSSPQLQLRHYRSSMRQKQHISLVNKVWNAYAQEVLYEFVWISRASQAKALALTLLSQACAAGVSGNRMVQRQSGRYIRRLHIETSSLERCNPADLRTILDYAPQLVVYSDYRSVRRNLYEEWCDPRSSPAQLFSALAHPNNSLRRLSWTNYDDVSFHLHMTPMLETTAANLEYLELNFCSSHLHSMFANDPIPLPPSTSSSPAIALTLPALRSLKVTLDNATFAVLSTWSMPSLLNLSVVSADFSYAGTGFSQFFRIHGPLLHQLELGHSSSTIEEHYLTLPPNASDTTAPIPLAEWCPNLREFICSADAEWNWQNPDWIAPHILLPTHPRLEFIGIRDIDKRLMDDAEFGPVASLTDDSPFFPLLEQISSLLHAQAFPSLMFIRDLSEGSDEMRSVCPQVRVVKFWQNVLARCRERKVWLEDCRGVNVTRRDLERAWAIARC